MPNQDPRDVRQQVTAFHPNAVEAQSALAARRSEQPQALERAVISIGRAPDDIARADTAIEGLTRCVATLATHMPAAQFLVDRLVQIPRYRWLALQPASNSVIALAGRKTRYYVWAALIDIGHVPAESLNAAGVADALTILGAHLLRCHLTGDTPQAPLVARCVGFARTPTSLRSLGWSSRARKTSLSKQLSALAGAVAHSPSTAAVLALSAPASPVTAVRAVGRIERGNRAHRRRLNNVAHYADDAARRATPGHGSLSPPALLAAGRQLRRRVECGNETALLMALQIITGLSPDTLIDVPLNGDADEHGDTPLAWLSLDDDVYIHRAFWLEETGAKPRPDVLHLYVPASARIEIKLPQFVVDALRRLVAAANNNDVAASRLATENITRLYLGDVLSTSHHPWASIDGNEAAGVGARITVARAVRGLTSAMIRQGVRRATGALLLSSQHLMSPGSKYYGVVAPEEIDSGWHNMMSALGWDEPGTLSRADGVKGSAVTPTLAALTDVFDSLSRAADQSDPWTTDATISEHVNSLSAWMAAYMALCLALRERTVYPITRADILLGNVLVNDKRVHVLGPGPALPVIDPLKAAMKCYWGRIAECAALARCRGDAGLAGELETTQIDHAYAIYRVDGSGMARPAGYEAWRECLPSSLRLVGNFGRHFWPGQLAKAGLGQTHIDLLLRHIPDGLEAHSTVQGRPIARIRGSLANAMTAVVQGLQLRSPEALR